MRKLNNLYGRHRRLVPICLHVLTRIQTYIYITHTHLYTIKYGCALCYTAVRIYNLRVWHFRKITKITNAVYNGERLDSYWRLSWRGKWTDWTNERRICAGQRTDGNGSRRSETAPRNCAYTHTCTRIHRGDADSYDMSNWGLEITRDA